VAVAVAAAVAVVAAVAVAVAASSFVLSLPTRCLRPLFLRTTYCDGVRRLVGVARERHFLAV
jgi:hypothetical protein